MKLTYDPRYNVAYFRFTEKRGTVDTIRVSDELSIDVGADGTVYGIELLNANEQLRGGEEGKLVVVNEASSARTELPLELTASLTQSRATVVREDPPAPDPLGARA